MFVICNFKSIYKYHILAVLCLYVSTNVRMLV